MTTTWPPRSLLLVSLLCALCAPGLSTAAPAGNAKAAARPGAAAPDFAEYQKFLDDYLTVISAKGEPVDTRFDYEKLYDARGRYERLARIKRGLMSVPPSQMNDAARKAWAVNVYNFTVIESGANHLLVPDRGRLRYKTLREIRLPEGPFFEAAVINVEGQKYSLDDFERHFLLAGFDRGTGGVPPAALDPRVHFAIVCGALGCPPLLPRAYRPDSLEIQLEFATRNALGLERHLRIRDKTRRLEASEIFQWYAADFGGLAKAFEFLVRYAPPAMQQAIQAGGYASVSGIIPWDWNLNQTVHKKAP